MPRAKLQDRTFPGYTKGEEIFNMVSHIVGGGLGIVMLILCITFALQRQDMWAVVTGAIYGSSLVCLYTMSSVYHGLRKCAAKKVMQVLDHCTIYFLIVGTYTPILLCSIREAAPVAAWVLFAFVWSVAALAIVFTAIDHDRYATFSMICYVGIGWCIICIPKILMTVLPPPGFILLLAGGIAYTIGAVLYGIGSKCRYMHSIFHLFVVAGSILHFLCIFFYVILD